MSIINEPMHNQDEMKADGGRDTKVMQAIRIHAYGGPDLMQLEEPPVQVPGPVQALMRVQAASVNFLDIQKRRGELVGQAFYQYVGASEPDLPAPLGSQ